MTLPELVKRIQRSFPKGGFLITTHVKQSIMMDRPDVWYQAHLTIPGKSIKVDAHTLDEIWLRFRSNLDRAPFKVDLAKLDVRDLERKGA